MMATKADPALKIESLRCNPSGDGFYSVDVEYTVAADSPVTALNTVLAASGAGAATVINNTTIKVNPPGKEDSVARAMVEEAKRRRTKTSEGADKASAAGEIESDDGDLDLDQDKPTGITEMQEAADPLTAQEGDIWEEQTIHKIKTPKAGGVVLCLLDGTEIKFDKTGQEVARRGKTERKQPPTNRADGGPRPGRDPDEARAAYDAKEKEEKAEAAAEAERTAVPDSVFKIPKPRDIWGALAPLVGLQDLEAYVMENYAKFPALAQAPQDKIRTSVQRFVLSMSDEG